MVPAAQGLHASACADLDALCRRISARFALTGGADVAVAVSGGSDSLALMHLVAPVAATQGLRLRVVTVDHRLRAASDAEAQAVARAAARLGLEHTTLVWVDHGAGHGTCQATVHQNAGNLPARARAARYRLMADWARKVGVGAILLGHTADDLAEGLIMRLARRAGVDGLSAMSDWREDRADPHGLIWVRPLLGVGRADLRGWLTDRGIGWIDDPTNDDPTYVRTRARAALRALAPLGICAGDLAAVAQNLRTARDALAHQAVEAARHVVTLRAGDLLFDTAGFCALPEEIRRRLLVGALGWITGNGYPPRQSALARLEAAACAGRRAQLAGCRVEPATQGVLIGREVRAVQGLCVPAGDVWDGRWHLAGGAAPVGACLRALGADGLSQCPDWRQTALPRCTLLASPALFLGDQLLGAPHAGYAQGWEIRLIPTRANFEQTLLAH